MTARVLLALCVVVGSTLCGRSLAGAARRRAETLASLAQGVRLLKVHMVSMFEPVHVALERSECPLLVEIGGRMRSGLSASDAWTDGKRALRRRRGPADALLPEDERLLDGLFERLGESGREAQEILLSAAALGLEELCGAAKGKVAEVERLYTTLGLLIGLMLALIVI